MTVPGTDGMRGWGRGNVLPERGGLWWIGGRVAVAGGFRCPAAGVDLHECLQGNKGQSPLPRGACRYSKDAFPSCNECPKATLRLLLYKVWTTMIIAKLSIFLPKSSIF